MDSGDDEQQSIAEQDARRRARVAVRDAETELDRLGVERQRVERAAGSRKAIGGGLAAGGIAFGTLVAMSVVPVGIVIAGTTAAVGISFWIFGGSKGERTLREIEEAEKRARSIIRDAQAIIEEIDRVGLPARLQSGHARLSRPDGSE